MSEDFIENQVDKALEILNVDEGAEDATQDVVQDNLQEEGETGEETLTEENKPNTEVEVEPETALEPPTSWRSDEKELFKNLPREAQEVALRIQQAQDSHFTQRSTELAQKIRATDDTRHQYEADRARYASELTQLNQIASQLLPAKFSDIQSEADYLRLKTTDPARASEYEAFQQILQGSMRQAEQVRQSQMNEHLNREWGSFVSKYPEFQDATKAQTMLDGVRKGAVEYYGYSPEETKIIADHRQIQVMRDALAWRQHLATQKTAQAKKFTPVQQRVIRTNGNVSVSNGGKTALLNRARKSDKLNDKVDAITALLNAG